MDRETLDLLEFDGVLGIIAEFARTPQGKSEVLATAPLGEAAAVETRRMEIAEAGRHRTEGPRLDFELPDATGVLGLLDRPTAGFDSGDLLTVLAYLMAGRELRKSVSASTFPHLARIVEPLRVPLSLLGNIQNCIDEAGDIRDTAHPELASVRRNQAHFRRKTQEHLSRFLVGTRSRFLIDEAFVTQRGGRYVVPVRVEHQKEVPGIVHGASSSGATVFLEPFSAVEFNNQLVFNQEREAEIIREVLRRLSDEAWAHGSEIREIVAACGTLDARFACAAFVEAYRCRPAELVEARRLLLREARHPLLIRALGDDAVVPVDLELDPESQILVISGPNTGGKTAALKTAGLLSLMAACGLPIPAARACLPLFGSVGADIGDHQSITDQLSTFSSHIGRIRELIRMHRPPGLVMLDELGRGTDPVYGVALAIAVLEHFRLEGSLVLATTHHRGVKSWAALTDGVRNASVSLAPGTLRPTYVLEYGVAGGSSGLDIARQLGLPEEVIEHAASLLEDSDALAEGYLSELRARIQELRDRQSEYEARLAEVRSLEAGLREAAAVRERESERRIDDVIERLGLQFRRETERQVAQLQDQSRAEEKRRQLRHREAALKEAFRRKVRADLEPAGDPSTVVGLTPGDTVYHPFFRAKGRLVALRDGEATLELGGKTLTCKADELRKVESGPAVERPVPGVVVSVVQDSDPELNLIGSSVAEAIPALDKYLDRAFVSRLPEVRIIHGFGTGKLKRSITEHLARHGHVASFEVEGGATRVFLRV
jgi:DNA mismatch repair protein MutS2